MPATSLESIFRLGVAFGCVFLAFISFLAGLTSFREEIWPGAVFGFVFGIVFLLLGWGCLRKPKKESTGKIARKVLGPGDKSLEQIAIEATNEARLGAAPIAPPQRPTVRTTQTVQPTPGWYLPAGVIAVITALLAFFASAAVGGGGDAFGSILAGLLNPLFFVGMPLGVYWLSRYANRLPVASNPPTVVQPPSEENNPKLTHCPDCGKHVSRLAVACPHCGRPLNGE